MTAVLMGPEAVTAVPDEAEFFSYVDRLYWHQPEVDYFAKPPLWITFDTPVPRIDRRTGLQELDKNGKGRTYRKAMHVRYDTNDLGRAWAFILEACASDSRSIYISLAPRTADLGQYHRGTAAQSAGMPCFFADLDFNEPGAKHRLGNLASEAETREVMALWPGPQPTFEAVTGGGVHLYWLTDSLVSHRPSGNPDTAEAEAADKALIDAFAVGIKQHFKEHGFHTDGSFGGNAALALRPCGAINKYGTIVRRTEVTGEIYTRKDFDFLAALAERAKKRKADSAPAGARAAVAPRAPREYAEGTSSLEWAQSDHPSAAFCRAMPVEQMLINLWNMYEGAPDEWFMDDVDETGFVTYSSDAAAVKIWRNSDDGIPRAHAYSSRVQPLWNTPDYIKGFTAFDLLVVQCGFDRRLALSTAKAYIS